jgi:hypothetical protein
MIFQQAVIFNLFFAGDKKTTGWINDKGVRRKGEEKRGQAGTERGLSIFSWN